MEKFVYAFNEGEKNMKNLLGGKGANLAEMTKLGLPVPNGFTVTTKACDIYYENNNQLTAEILEQINMALKELETMSNKVFGKVENPLLLSVRSGAVSSMPGMMDTVLNVGLNDAVVESLASRSSNPRFVYDSYRRFISMYADVVEQLDKDVFEDILTAYKTDNNLTTDQDLTIDDLKKIIVDYKAAYKEFTKKDFGNDPKEHLINVILSVFRSWNNKRAIEYRKVNNIGEEIKTAVNVQEMVMGNMNEQSATGVVFSRNPSSGEQELYGEFLTNAQGEDIVAGVRTPMPISKLKTFMPDLYHQLLTHATSLERHFQDMQDMEFTIENGKLFMLQTRNGKRSGIAAVKVAIDLLKEGIITEQDLIERVTISDLKAAMHSSFTPEAKSTAVTLWTGLSASPGAAFGHIYFSSEDLEKSSEQNKVLVRLETSADDIIGMKLANAIVTGRGGMTSHAAVVARGMGKVSVTGCEQITIDEDQKQIILPDNTVINEGDVISVDGTNGIVYQGELAISSSNTSPEYYELIDILNKYQKINVIANAETAEDLAVALDNGADGVGLCRTEHMFFEETRLNLFKQMILVDNPERKSQILTSLEDLHKDDFISLFKLLDKKSITVRYLDPPFHEFMPKEEADIQKLAADLNMQYDDLVNRINGLHEFNPMMGERGARLLVTNADITVMQTRAIAKALKEVSELGINPDVSVMIPLVVEYQEALYLKELIVNALKTFNIKLEIGIMIETPRSAIIAHHLAPLFDFYSFGTNDLTQLTYGISRDDCNKFLPTYLYLKLIPYDPFVTIDGIGVGTLIKTAINNGKKANDKLKIGICGEHAGDPTSVDFFSTLDINYLSCSPYRIPLIKLAIAKFSLKKE